jgi:hypothetical protein
MMTKWSGLACATIAALALSSTGCDAIKKMISPRMDKPTIGTRVSAMATLDIKDTAKNAKYLGCDLKYWNMPAGSKIKLTWHVFEDEKSAKKDKDVQHTDGKEQIVTGNGVINAYLQALDGEFSPGIYECRWEAIADKKVDGGEQSAKVTVGDVGSGKSKKSSDDDDDAPKKKKKKSDDD